MNIQAFDLKLAAIEAPAAARGSVSLVKGAKGVRPPIFLGERHRFQPQVLKLIKT